MKKLIRHYIEEAALKRSFITVLSVLFFMVSFSYAGFLDDMLKKIPSLSSKQELDDSTVISGLKEALSIGTDKRCKRGLKN